MKTRIKNLKNTKPGSASKKPVIHKTIKKNIKRKKVSFITSFILYIKRLHKYLKKGITKRVIISFSIALILTILFFVFSYKKSGYINGNVIFQGSTYFSYSDAQNPDSGQVRISPLCGCLVNLPHRGVMFFPHSFDLISEYEDPTAGTQFFISCPEQDMTYNPLYYFKAKIYFLDYSLEDYSTRDVINTLLNFQNFSANPNPTIRTNSLIDSIVCDTTFHLQIVTFTNKLHLELIDRFPISAFIPMKKSEISVIKQNLNNYNSFSNYYLQEKYIKDTIDKWELPMVDVLGPNIAITCNAKQLKINGKKYELKDINKNIASCVILLKVGFQARIASNMIDTGFFRFMDSANVKWITNIINYRGTTRIVPKPLNNDEFIKLKSIVDTTYLFESPAVYYGNPNLAVSSWGLPELSQYNGVYFFGQNLSHLVCDEATGVCQYGNSSYHFEPSRKIELKNIRDFVFNDEPVITPLSYNSNSQFTNKFKGRGELYIDNEFVGESIIDSKWLPTILILLGLLSSIITTIMFIRDLSRKKT